MCHNLDFVNVMFRTPLGRIPGTRVLSLSLAHLRKYEVYPIGSLWKSLEECKESSSYLEVGFYTSFLVGGSPYLVLGDSCHFNYSLSQNPLMWHGSSGDIINTAWSLESGAINTA